MSQCKWVSSSPRGSKTVDNPKLAHFFKILSQQSSQLCIAKHLFRMRYAYNSCKKECLTKLSKGPIIVFRQTQTVRKFKHRSTKLATQFVIMLRGALIRHPIMLALYPNVTIKGRFIRTSWRHVYTSRPCDFLSSFMVRYYIPPFVACNLLPA